MARKAKMLCYPARNKVAVVPMIQCKSFNLSNHHCFDEVSKMTDKELY